MNTKRTLSGLLVAAVLAASLPIGSIAAPKATYRLPPLDPQKEKVSLPGKFVWGDLFTSDPQGTSEFYSELFGWKSEQFGEGDAKYILLKNGDRPVAGIALNPAIKAGFEDAKARWIGYVSVDDIDAATERVTEAGGTVLVQPRDIPNRGTIAIVMDSDYLILGLIKSTSGDPADHEAAIGEWIWVQLVTKSPEDAVPFYTSVFGYEAVPDERTPVEGDYLLMSDGMARAGLTPATSEDIKRGGWLGFVRCEDAAETAAKAQNLGATLLVPPSEANAEENVAVIIDPFGGVVGIYSIQSN